MTFEEAWRQLREDCGLRSAGSPNLYRDRDGCIVNVPDLDNKSPEIRRRIVLLARWRILGERHPEIEDLI